MTSVFIKTDSHYKVNRKRIRSVVENFLIENKVKGKTEVSIAVVGDRQMRKLNNKYRNIDKPTDVLAFPLQGIGRNSTYIDPPDDVLRLGDIVISYPQVIERATDEERLVDDKIDELIVHGLKNLMGI